MRAIDADNLTELEELEYEYIPERNGEPWYMAKDVWKCIDEAPTIEVPPRWIPVTERLPEGECIAVNDRKEIMIGYIVADTYNNTGYFAESEYEVMGNVTHWMPLPNAPKDGDT